jgi:hypothetical protein
MTGCVNSEFNYIENLTVSQKLVFPCKTHIDDAPVSHRSGLGGQNKHNKNIPRFRVFWFLGWFAI